MTRRVRDEDAQWHLDKKVPLALILAILLQTGGIVWWGATASERLSALERKADLAAPQDTRLTRVEVKVDNLIDATTEIKSILRKEPLPARRN